MSRIKMQHANGTVRYNNLLNADPRDTYRGVVTHANGFRTLVLRKGGVVRYGIMCNRKPPYTSYTINAPGQGKFYFTEPPAGDRYQSPTYSRYSGSGNQTWHGWEGWSREISYFSAMHLAVRCCSYSGNFDEIGIEVRIANSNNLGQYITRRGHWGTGDNWEGCFSSSWNISYSDLKLIGGPNAKVRVNCRLMTNRGSHGVGNSGYYVITTS